MPRGDRTGPQGMGSMTGRGMGLCAGYDTPGYLNAGPGFMGMGRGMGFARGFGRGGGRGMAWGRGGGARWYAPPVYGYSTGYGPGYSQGYSPLYQQNPEQERAFIEDQLKGIKIEMEAMEKRLSEISKGEGEK